MNGLIRLIIGEDGQRSIVADLRSGRAGWAVRLGLSLACAAVIAAVGFFCAGLIEDSGNLQEEHIALIVGVGGGAWCVLLAFLWAAHRKWARALRTIFALIAIWLTTICLCVIAVEITRSEEFFISALVFLAIGLSIAIVVASIYRGLGGKAMVERTGEVRVKCPQCDYSLVGLESCTCPECGARFTIDQLIAAQDYAALRDARLDDNDTPVHIDPKFAVPSAEY